jgi:spore maturation protein CgeB
MTPDARLERNLAALARRDRALAERLCWPVDASHVRSSEDGSWRLRVHQGWVPLQLSPSEVAAALAPVAKDESGEPHETFVFGAGTGEMTAQLLAARARAPVTVWDRDPFMLRLTLSQVDWSHELAAGRLRLALGADLFAEIGRLPAAVAFHPVLGQIYRNERALLSAASGPRALICAGGLFVDDLSEALRARGYAVFTLDAVRLAVEELALTVRVAQPVLVAAINYTEGLAEFCQAEGVPLVCWEVDPVLQRLSRVTPPPALSHVFTYRRTNVAEFQSAGFPHVEYLPLAANPARRAPLALPPDERRRFAAPVAFVGASLADRIGDLRADFVRAFVAFRSAAGTGAPVPEQVARLQGEQLLDQLLAGQRADLSHYAIPQLLEQLQPAFRTHCQQSGAVDAEQIAGELAAGEKRLALIAALASACTDEDSQVHVWGDAGWQAAGPQVRYRGVAGHMVELSKIYGSARVNLDIGRLYQMDIVTMRVFDVLACGGFLLTERSSVLSELFTPGHDLDVFTGPDELIEKTRYYLARPDLAARIAAQGRATVVGKHTVAQRLGHMLATLPGSDH